MRLPLFVLRQLKPISPSVLLLERVHPEFRKEQISSLHTAAAMGRICLVFNFTLESVTGGNLWKLKA
jgi:hypothetical protein